MGKVIIIGSGPAGVSAALYTLRGGHETIIITKDRDGGGLAKAEKIENYYGLSEPISGKELLEKGLAGALRLGATLVEDEVVGLVYESSLVVTTTKSRYEADAVVIATGASRRTASIKGLAEYEGNGVSYCAVCDGFFYRNKPVVVLGNSEYAFHEASALLPLASSVTLLTDGKEPEGKVPEGIVVRKEKIKEIVGDAEALASLDLMKVAKVSLEGGDSISCDGIFVAYGVAGSTDLAKKIGAATEGNKIVIDETMATSIPGLYAAGDCTGGLLQVAKAVYEGAQAGNSIVKFL